MIELRHLRTLLALRETGSLVEAAERVHLTQSALSHQLKDLESRVDSALFVRKTRPVEFTRAGLRLLALADDSGQVQATHQVLAHELGTARVLRRGDDVTILALAAMVPRALAAAERLEDEDGVSATVVDVRSLVPLDTQTILAEVSRTGRAVTVEENPRLCGWGAEIASLIADELFYDLDGPVVRITTPHIPLPSADHLEDLAMPSIDRIVATIRARVD